MLMIRAGSHANAGYGEFAPVRAPVPQADPHRKVSLATLSLSFGRAGVDVATASMAIHRARLARRPPNRRWRGLALDLGRGGRRKL
jgi:hypothetical protein